ncbi:hypothetical protein [Streptomyces sp. NBC_01537]|uniref:hypothetical protein n=1 Tax=Streptomyces sp. NBC_01537 TaxID=2903896 RepID=UPI0038693AB9
MEEFLIAAKGRNADVEVIDVPLGHHGFETTDHADRARHAVERAMRSVLRHPRRSTRQALGLDPLGT